MHSRLLCEKCFSPGSWLNRDSQFELWSCWVVFGLYPTTIHNRYFKTDPEWWRNSGKTVWPVSSPALQNFICLVVRSTQFAVIIYPKFIGGKGKHSRPSILPSSMVQWYGLGVVPARHFQILCRFNYKATKWVHKLCTIAHVLEIIVESWELDRRLDPCNWYSSIQADPWEFASVLKWGACSSTRLAGHLNSIQVSAVSLNPSVDALVCLA